MLPVPAVRVTDIVVDVALDVSAVKIDACPAVTPSFSARFVHVRDGDDDTEIVMLAPDVVSALTHTTSNSPAAGVNDALVMAVLFAGAPVQRDNVSLTDIATAVTDA